MQIALAEQTTNDLSSIFGYLNKLENLEITVIERLPDASDEEVIETRNYARMLGKSAWRIECACDAELINRTHARRGRGHVDKEEKGVKKTVASRAAELGCHPRTIERNAEIHKLVSAENGVNVHTILEDKGFYEAALRAPNPKKALKLFAKAKADNPFFTVRDAWREVDALKKKPRPQLSKDLKEIKDQAMREHIQYAIRVISTDLKLKCPDPEFCGRYYDQWLEDLQFALTDLGDHDLRELLLKAWGHGNRTTTELATAVGHTPEEAEQELVLMENLNIVERVKQGGKTEQARGDRTSLWLLKGEPTGELANVPRSGTHYRPQIDWGDDED